MGGNQTVGQLCAEYGGNPLSGVPHVSHWSTTKYSSSKSRSPHVPSGHSAASPDNAHMGRCKRIRRRQKRDPEQVVTPSSCNTYYVKINGYKSKTENLKQLIVERNVDILLLAETKVYSTSGVKIQGLQVFPAVRKKTCGGG